MNPRRRYEKVVDRLLASPRYGERMAVVWLDAARYADTNGYNNDEDRIMWPWRDWVIDAFNRNLPYDRFIVEQLAGDLLPNPTIEQQVATAFHRNLGHNTEGGIIEEEYRVEYVADRVQTTSAIFLGLTMQCARCHDHKFDPITQKDYYRFFGFFNSIDEKQASYVNFTAAEPTLLLPTPQQQLALKSLNEDRAVLQKQIADREAKADDGLWQWEQTHSPDEINQLSSATPTHRFALDEKDGTIGHDSADAAKANDLPGASIIGKANWTDGHVGGALAFDGNTFADAGSIAGFDGTEPFSFSAWVRPTSNEPLAVLSRMDEGDGDRGYDLLVDGGKVYCHLVHHWPGNAIKVISHTVLSLNNWHHLAVTYDGSRKAAGVRLYLDGKPESTEIASDNLTDTIAIKKSFHIGRRETGLSFKGAIGDVQIYDGVLGADDAAQLASDKPLIPAAELLRIAAKDRTPEQREQLRRKFLDRLDPQYARVDLVPG